MKRDMMRPVACILVGMMVWMDMCWAVEGAGGIVEDMTRLYEGGEYEDAMYTASEVLLTEGIGHDEAVLAARTMYLSSLRIGEERYARVGAKRLLGVEGCYRLEGNDVKPEYATMFEEIRSELMGRVKLRVEPAAVLVRVRVEGCEGEREGSREIEVEAVEGERVLTVLSEAFPDTSVAVVVKAGETVEQELRFAWSEVSEVAEVSPRAVLIPPDRPRRRGRKTWMLVGGGVVVAAASVIAVVTLLGGEKAEDLRPPPDPPNW